MNTQANAMTTVPAVLLKKQVGRWIARGAKTATRVTMKIIVAPMKVVEGVLNGEGMVLQVGPDQRPLERHEFENVHVREARNFHGWM